MAGGVAHNVTVAAVNHPELLYMQVTDHLMAGIEDVVGMRGRNHIRVSLALFWLRHEEKSEFILNVTHECELLQIRFQMQIHQKHTHKI